MKKKFLGAIITSALLIIGGSLIIPGIRTQAASLRGDTNEEKIFYFAMQDMKFNNASACGALANIRMESSFNPAAVGDNGTSFGICQWHNDRASRLRAWCDDHDYDWHSMEGQLNYLDYELKTYYPNTLNLVKSVPNSKNGAYTAAYNWCYYYEIPANRSVKADERGNSAKNTYWPKYKDIEIGLTKGKKYTTDLGVFKATSDFTVTFVKMADKSATTLKIPDKVTINDVSVKVTAISNNACKGNKNLTQVTIGKNVEKIGKQAFFKCSNLSKVTFKTTKLKSVGKKAFSGIKKDAKIYAKKKYKKDLQNLLKGKTPKNVKYKNL